MPTLKRTDVYMAPKDMSDAELDEQATMRRDRIAELDEAIADARSRDDNDVANHFIEFRGVPGKGKPTGRILTPSRYAAKLSRERREQAEELTCLDAEIAHRRADLP